MSELGCEHKLAVWRLIMYSNLITLKRLLLYDVKSKLLTNVPFKRKKSVNLQNYVRRICS